MKKVLPSAIAVSIVAFMFVLTWQLLFPPPARHEVITLNLPYYTFLISKQSYQVYLFTREDNRLKKIITDSIATASGEWSVAVDNLTTGQRAYFNEKAQMPAASLYKIPVMIAWFNKAREEGGQIDPAILQGINRMITVSSNEDGQWLGSSIGWDNVSNLMGKLGYTQTKLDLPPVTSAADMSKMLSAIYNEELVTPDWSREMFNILKGQKIRDRIPKLLPTSTVVANKTGEIDDYRHDVAIIETPKNTYVLAFLAGRLTNPEEAKQLMAEVSIKIYEYFETQFQAAPSQIL